MEDTIIEEKPGLFSRLGKFFGKDEVEDTEDEFVTPNNTAHIQRATARYTITVRRGVTTFDDAMAAALGMKHGDQQILNLNGADPALRQKIVDFMSGVNFAHEGTWEEIGENIYLIVPPHAFVEVAPASARMNALRN